MNIGAFNRALLEIGANAFAIAVVDTIMVAVATLMMVVELLF